MSAVHIPIQLLLVTILVVYIAEERPTSRRFVGGARHDHPQTDISTCDAMHNIIDEAVAGVELAACLAIRTAERVLTLKGSAACDISNSLVHAIRN